MNWENIETRGLLLKGLEDSDAEPFMVVDEARQLIRHFGSDGNTTINTAIPC